MAYVWLKLSVGQLHRLNGFHKKSTKDYTKAIKKAERILKDYL